VEEGTRSHKALIFLALSMVAHLLALPAACPVGQFQYFDISTSTSTQTPTQKKKKKKLVFRMHFDTDTSFLALDIVLLLRLYFRLRISFVDRQGVKSGKRQQKKRRARGQQ